VRESAEGAAVLGEGTVEDGSRPGESGRQRDGRGCLCFSGFSRG
jgi:hypothetical protein